MTQTMPEFAYTARTASGKDVVGTITAGSKRETLCALAEQSLFPLQVESAEPARSKWQLKRRLKASLVATNLSQLADLLENGVPMLEALDILVDQATHPRLAEVLADVRDQVAEGSTTTQYMWIDENDVCPKMQISNSAAALGYGELTIELEEYYTT